MLSFETCLRYDRRMSLRPTAPLLLALLPLLLGACRGTVPALNGPPEAGIASILVGCRIILTTGDTSTGKVALNLEGEDGNGETYRLPLEPQRTLLYQVEPGVYRLAPTRSIFGFHQDKLKVVVEGRKYLVPFPREILRKAPLDIKPKKILALGTLEIKLTRIPGHEAALRVTLDDSVEARRTLVQREIRLMMDPKATDADRSSALAWTRALEEQLSAVVTEARRGPAYRPAQ